MMGCLFYWKLEHHTNIYLLDELRRIGVVHLVPISRHPGSDDITGRCVDGGRGSADVTGVINRIDRCYNGDVNDPQMQFQHRSRSG